MRLKAARLTHCPRPRGLMDKASASGAGDSGFESLRGRSLSHNAVPISMGDCVVTVTAFRCITAHHLERRLPVTRWSSVSRCIAALIAPGHTATLKSILCGLSGIWSLKFRVCFLKCGFTMCRFARAVRWASHRALFTPLEVARQPSLPQVEQATYAVFPGRRCEWWESELTALNNAHTNGLGFLSDSSPCICGC